MRRFHLLFTLPVGLLLAATVWPLASGARTLILRDVLHAHYPLKVSQAEAMRDGDLLPLVDPYRSFGQPLLGNLNAVPFYPADLLLLVASPLWALNAHFWIHWLLAPLAGYWLGRAWGLGRPAAAAVGATYASGGFFLSLLNFYNLVAGAALAPALVAAGLDLTDPARGDRPGVGRRAALAGGLWGLLLLAGDPLFALLAGAMAVAAVVVRQGSRVPRQVWGPATIAAICGTLVAAPQIVAMARILPLSFRGHFQFSPAAVLAQSWDPRTLVEWLLPLAFGGPDLDFWGARFHGGNEPLLLSLHPGILLLALVAIAGRARPAARWGWALLGAGAFFALGVWNPLVLAFVRWQSTAVVRYPVKLWLVGAVGLAILAGVGVERLVAGGSERRARLVLVALACGLGLAAVVLLRSSLLDPVLALLDPVRLAPGAPQRLRWAVLAALVAGVAAAGAILAVALRRRPAVLAAALVTLHVATQLAFLRPLLASDEAAIFAAPPPILAAVPPQARLVHGGFRGIFGPPAGPLPELPELSLRWLERMYVAQAQPFAGIPWGRRYAMNGSPEGLDSFYSVALERRLAGLEDGDRVRLLANSGVDVLLLDRELAPAAAAEVRLLARHDVFGRPVHAYDLGRRAPPVRVVGEAVAAPHLNAAVDRLVDPAHDPSRQVVLPDAVTSSRAPRPPGRVLAASEERDGFRLEVESPSGGWVVVERAFLPLYRARVDGRDRPLSVADGQLMAVAVEPGRHQVEIRVDRRPTHLAVGLAVVAAAGLALLALAPRRRRESS